MLVTIPMLFKRLLVLGAALALDFTPSFPQPAASSDNAVTIQSADAGRLALQRQIWGTSGFPADAEPSAEPLKPSSPDWTRGTEEMGLSGYSGFARLEKLAFALPGGLTAIGYHLVANGHLNRLVIVHQGHYCGFDHPGTGLEAAIKTLLSRGYSVATLYMPRPSPCSDRGMVPFHRELFKRFAGDLSGSPLQLFLDSAAQTVNYAEKTSHYARIDMIGLSGGGWATTVYAAADRRIRLSVPVAGSRPRSLPACGLNLNDPEQNAIASYLDLYALGSLGAGRRQIQVLNKYDTCCFQVICGKENLEPRIRSYEETVVEADKKLGGGNFSVYIDADSHAHQISAVVLEKVILPALQLP